MDKNSLEDLFEKLNGQPLHRHMIRALINFIVVFLIYKLFEFEPIQTHLLTTFTFIALLNYFFSFVGRMKIYSVKAAIAYIMLCIVIALAPVISSV